MQLLVSIIDKFEHVKHQIVTGCLLLFSLILNRAEF